jgi:hypothetical protein
MRTSMKSASKLLMGMVLAGAALTAGAGVLQAAQEQGPPPPMQGLPPSAPLPPDQMHELVAPIALYPDALVAQILAASAFPTQIVEAERFMQENPNLQGQELGSAVDQQDWDPSVKALTQFPSVLADMDKNLSWTSELGDVNYNQPQDVMDSIQYMRHQAQNAGNLNSSPQENVANDGPDIDIAPANPEIVYVPEYDPEDVFGYPVGIWPGFDPWWGVGGPYISFGYGIGIGGFGGFGWGWGGWGMDWRHHGGMMYGGQRYRMHSNSFYNRNAFMRGNYRGEGNFAQGDRGLRGFGGGRAGGLGGMAHGGSVGGARAGSPGGARAGSIGGDRRGSFGGSRSGGFGGARSSAGTRSSAFSGFGFGGQSRGFSSRGSSSMHGGGFGGGGMRGGGFGGGGMHGGGGRR